MECFRDPCAAADRAMDAAIALYDAWEQYEEEQKPKRGWEWWKDSLRYVIEHNGQGGRSADRARFEGRLRMYQYFDSLAKKLSQNPSPSV